MKTILWLIWICHLTIFSFAQQAISISTDKTVSLIFPFPIVHVDRGTKDVLAQQVPEVNNILLVKAAIGNFSITNLSVITEDGSVYAFKVQYESNPSNWIWHIPIQEQATIASYANSILYNPRTVHGVKQRKWDMSSKLIGVYIHGDVIYFQLRLENKSPIDYKIDLLRFSIRDKSTGKRTAIQESEVKPLYIAGNSSKVKGNAKNVLVVAFKTFTIPDEKYFNVQAGEVNGGRNLQMKVHNNKILEATPLPDLK